MIQIDARMEEEDLADYIEARVFKKYKKAIQVLEILPNRLAGSFDFFYTENDMMPEEYKGEGQVGVLLKKDNQSRLVGLKVEIEVSLK